MTSTAAAEQGSSKGAIGYSIAGQSHRQEGRMRTEDENKQNWERKIGREMVQEKRDSSFTGMLQKCPPDNDLSLPPWPGTSVYSNVVHEQIILRGPQGSDKS